MRELAVELALAFNNSKIKTNIKDSGIDHACTSTDNPIVKKYVDACTSTSHVLMKMSHVLMKMKHVLRIRMMMTMMRMMRMRMTMRMRMRMVMMRMRMRMRMMTMMTMMIIKLILVN